MRDHRRGREIDRPPRHLVVAPEVLDVALEGDAVRPTVAQKVERRATDFVFANGDRFMLDAPDVIADLPWEKRRRHIPGRPQTMDLAVFEGVDDAVEWAPQAGERAPVVLVEVHPILLRGLAWHPFAITPVRAAQDGRKPDP